jgi:hypothetical protein
MNIALEFTSSLKKKKCLFVTFSSSEERDAFYKVMISSIEKDCCVTAD